MTFVLYFEREKDYYEVLTKLQKNGINPEHQMAPYLIKGSANLGEIDINGAEILSHPIEPSILEKALKLLIPTTKFPTSRQFLRQKQRRVR